MPSVTPDNSRAPWWLRRHRPITARGHGDSSIHRVPSPLDGCIFADIGGGAVCTTRIKTGFGMPNLSAIKSCARVDRSVVADGGIRTPGDIVKALAFGADFVMVGNSLRSDILPVLEIGARGVHVPYHTTWALEHVEDTDLPDRVDRIDDLEFLNQAAANALEKCRDAFHWPDRGKDLARLLTP